MSLWPAVRADGAARFRAAGTMESSDLLVTLSPGKAGDGLKINLESPTKLQYGDQIVAAVKETLKEFELEDVVADLNDKGALDCTIRARLRVAVGRAGLEGAK